jgi:pyruvate dehydrogenase E2 component (dihydrolipoamide acetyltransferase)
MARLLRVVEVATGSTEVMLHEWAVPERTGYSVGDVLATLENDKAFVDIEADADGTLVAHLAKAGDTVEVGAPIALLASPGEQVPDLAAELRRLGVTADVDAGSEAGLEHRAVDPVPDQPSVSSMSSQSSQSSQPVTPASPSSAGEHPERVFSSPLARRMARDAGLTVSELVGSGPGGRIVKRDVRAAIDRRGPVAVGPATTAPLTPSGSTTPPYVDVPHTGVRRATAARLTQSKQTTPHFYLRAGVLVDELEALRSRLADAGVKVSVTDLVVKAVALAHTEVPEMNVIWTPEAVRSFASVDIAVAVATDRGLLTPVLRGVEQMTVSALAESARALVGRARSGALRQHELEGGTITVTNLGMFGVEEFTAIINPPQSAILAVGAARPEAVAADGELAVRSVMHVVLAVDHRPVDGTVAARWLQVLVRLLEEPIRLLV